MSALETMYSRGDDNRFLEVTCASGDKELLYFHDFISGALIDSVVRRAKKFAVKRYIGGAEKGLTTEDLLAGVREEFKENEDLPNTTNPDDWAKMLAKRASACSTSSLWWAGRAHRNGTSKSSSIPASSCSPAGDGEPAAQREGADSTSATRPPSSETSSNETTVTR